MAKTFDQIISEFETKRGLTVGRPKQVVGLPTGNMAIDWMTGVGGVPRGRITELYGLESSGKTTAALMTAVQLQKVFEDKGTDERILYIDFEHTLDSEYAASLGIDFVSDSFVPLQPTYLEQGAQAALDLIETGDVRLVVFDSVAAMAPRRLKEGEFDQATMQMHRAKLVSALCQTMVGLLDEKDCAAVFVNHKMEGIDISGRPGLPPRITTPGGRGLKFYASLRLEFNVIGQVKGTAEDLLTNDDTKGLVGQRVEVKCVKNKVGVPGRTVEVRSRFGHGFDNVWTALKILIDHKLVTKNGSWLHFYDRKTTGTGDIKLQGEAAVSEKADGEPEWGNRLIDCAYQALRKQVETT